MRDYLATSGITGLEQLPSGNFLYKTWKLMLTSVGSLECVRINPVNRFRATSLRAACKKIDRLEGENVNSGVHPREKTK